MTVDKDKQLMEFPEGGPFTENIMFVCTYEATLGNLQKEKPFDLLGRLTPTGAVKALNCNYGHVAQAGYEQYIKKPRPPPPPHVRQRKLQGDGTCFNSCVQATITFDGRGGAPVWPKSLRNVLPGKTYELKTFPSTGKTQVPGVTDPDLRDGVLIAQTWAEFLTASGASAAHGSPVAVVACRPLMMNYKFALVRSSDRIMFNLHALFEHFVKANTTDTTIPFPIREVVNDQEKQKIALKFAAPGENYVRVNMFCRGKINLLGASGKEAPKKIYAYLSRLFSENWAKYVVLRPKRDSEKTAPPPAQPPAQPPAKPLAQPPAKPLAQPPAKPQPPAQPPAKPQPPTTPLLSSGLDSILDYLFKDDPPPPKKETDEERAARLAALLDEVAGDEVVDEDVEQH